MEHTNIHANDSSHGTISRPIHLFELLTLFVFLTGLAGVGLLTLNKFDSLYTLIIGAFLTLLAFKTFKCQLQFKDQRFDLYLLGILLIALFFTAKPYLYVMGGQDQGLYVNMSATYERTGSTFIQDSLRASLAESEKSLYDAHFYYPGIYIHDLSKSEYVYQFYPLHPIWLAIFGKLFGADDRVYSLVFFSLISIITFFLLAYELSGGKKLPGYLIALLLAVNPLFAFFSKFPLSEMVMVAFSSLGFYYLLRYYKGTREDAPRRLYLFLSSLAFFSLFFVHISGFFYMPIFYLLLLLTLIYVTNQAEKKWLIMYYFSVFFSYFLSVLYGLNYSPTYARDIYRIEVSRLFVMNPTIQISISAILAILLPFLVVRFQHNLKNMIRRLQPHLFNLIALSFFILILFNFYQALHLDIDLRTSTNFVLILYFSPFGTLLFLLALNQIRKWYEIPFFILLIFLLIFWIPKVTLTGYVNYQYYGSRYLFSEVIVYSLLLIALYGGYLLREKDVIKKICTCGLIAGMLIYFFYFTSYQLQGQEGDGSNKALSLIAEEVDENDLLLSTFTDSEIITPLPYYYGLNLFAIPKQEVANDDLINKFLDSFNDVFVLSNGPLSNPNLETVNMIAYKQGIFEHPVNMLPKKFFYHRLTNLYLYRISRHDYFTPIIRPSNFRLTNFYSDRYWTNGNGIISEIGLKLVPESNYIVLHTLGHNPIRANLERLNLKLFINNIELKFNKRDGNSYYFEINPAIKEINTITINSSTFTPQEFGINTDTRSLGVDVAMLKIESQ